MNRVDRPRSSQRIVIAASSTSNFLKRAADYVCDGTADDVEIVAADALAQAMVIATAYAAPVIEFLPGQYSLSSPITKGSAPWVGDVANLGVRLKWDGAAGATVVTQNGATAGSCSFGGLKGIQFTAGANEPATWLDLTDDAIDVFYQNEYNAYGACSGDAINMSGWVNCHWPHLRFDNPGGYAIRATVPASQNCSDMSLHWLTYAHTRSSGPGKGVVMIDNSVGETNIGTVTIEHGRIEVQSGDPWDTIANGATRAIVTLKLPDAAPPVRSCKLHLADLAYSDSSGMADDSLFYRDTTDTTGSEQVIIENVTAANLKHTFGGTWSATMPLFDFPASGIGFLQMQGMSMVIFSTEEHRSSTSTADAWTVKVANEAVNRLAIRADGLFSASDGTNPVDATWGRSAAGKVTVTAATGLACSGPIAPNNTLAKDYAGSGSPEGVVAAAIGSTYRRTDGGAGTCFYVKESGGTGNTGWVAK